MQTVRNVIHAKILAFPGGYDAVATALLVKSGDYLRQKVMRHKGASLDIEEFRALADVIGCDGPMMALAASMDGLFCRVYAQAEVDNTDVAMKVGQVSSALGAMIAEFQLSLADDGEIDRQEGELLVRRAAELYARSREFVGLAVRVYGTAEAQAVYAAPAA